jgi:hypothetical protein
VDVPANLLHPHIHYLRAKDYTPEQLAAQLHAKVRTAEASGQEVRSIGSVVQEAMDLRLPKVVPTDFSKYEELGVAFEYLAEQFSRAAPQLRTKGFICTVNRMQDRISVRVERHGNTIYAMDINRGGSWGDDK